MEQGKQHTTTTSTSFHDAPFQSSQRITGRKREILLAFAIITIPMIIFNALLLGLIQHFRVFQNDVVSPNLSFDKGANNNDAYYVNISATTLITIASWASTAAPLLIASAVTLASYPIARRILLASENNDLTALPTPYQFALLLRMLSNSSPTSLWHWLKYRFGRRETQSKPLRSMSLVFILGTVLSLLVFASDTWLHLSTKTVAFPQITSVDLSTLKHNFVLRPDCYDVNETFMGGCTLNPAAANTFLYGTNDSTDTLSLLVNISSTSMIRTFTDGSDQYAYIGVPALASLDNIDYTATSYAIKSSCTPYTAQCFSEQRIAGPSAWYDCPYAMQDWISTTNVDTIKWSYFTDGTGKNNDTTSVALQNPYYYAAVFSVNQNLGSETWVVNDTGMTNGLHGSTIYAGFCEATVYDLEYTIVNGTVTRFIPSLSNSSMTNILQGSQHYTQVGSPFIIQASSVAVRTSKNSEDVSQQFALAYSRAALAVAAPATVSAPALEAQQRSQILVARVPKAPLYALIASSFLLVLLGIILTVLAFAAVGGDTGEVQARLSITGLVAAHFEGERSMDCVGDVDDMFDEKNGIHSRRIGVQRSERGGWVFG